MTLTHDQVLALAPDTGSAAAGKKLGNPKFWKNLGQNTEALWGECRGSALYQIRVDPASLAIQCSCPSRKFPCKHGLGLLLIAATTPAALPLSTPPDWVQSWLTKRAASAAAREQRQAKETPIPARDAAATRSKRADARLALVTQGIERLDLWMSDLVRNGLAGVETQPATFWERQAAQMVDAQAPGLAARLRQMAAIPASSPDWPEKLLGELGRLALLTHAFRRLDALAPSLQEDVRRLIGWSLKEEEVAARGEVIADDWLILGQRIVDEESLRVQRNWLLGTQTGRAALILQFSVARAPFTHLLLPGTHLVASLTFWPSAYPQRARLEMRRGEAAPVVGALSGYPTIDAFQEQVGMALARQPWVERFLCVLHEITPVRQKDGRWYACDKEGAALPLTKEEHWRLLALSGGAPVDLAGEWNGETLLPLSLVANDTFFLLGGEN